MSSLSPKDRVSLCSFTFSDGRRCRTPRNGKNPRFCFDHAQKEVRARTAQKLGKDLAYFFSGDYLSACDLSTALARLIPAVVRGDVKPKTARTVAYLAQTLLQAIHISQDEYINTFGTDGWRKSVRNSVNGNRDYLFPPDPEPEQSESPQPQPLPAQPQPQAQQPASQPAETPVNCHSERSDERPTSGASPESYREESAFSESLADLSQIIPAPQHTHSPIPTQPPPTSCHAPQTPASPSHPNHDASTTDKTNPIPTTQSAQSGMLAAKPDNPPRTRPSTPQSVPNRVARALHFDHSCHLFSDGKPF
jgi:hypothetical protein